MPRGQLLRNINSLGNRKARNCSRQRRLKRSDRAMQSVTLAWILDEEKNSNDESTGNISWRLNHHVTRFLHFPTLTTTVAGEEDAEA